MKNSAFSMVELGTTNVRFYADQPFNLILTILSLFNDAAPVRGREVTFAAMFELRKF